MNYGPSSSQLWLDERGEKRMKERRNKQRREEKGKEEVMTREEKRASEEE